MKMSKKLRIFALVTAILTFIFTVSICAADKLDQNMHGGDLSFGERVEYALQGSATGMIMIFSVLGLLWFIVYLARVVLYDIPNKKKQEAKNKEKKAAPVVNVAAEAPVAAAPVQTSAVAQDDGELVAVITAAIAAMIESGDYKNEFVGGFRVVSFKRSSSGAWNRK